jgi:hypothetical protein
VLLKIVLYLIATTNTFTTSSDCAVCHFRLITDGIITYLLAPWNRVLKKLIGFHRVKKFPTFYRTRRFITAFTSARHLSLSWASSIQSIKSHFPSPSLRSYQSISPGLRLFLQMIRKRIRFDSEELSELRPSTKLEDRPLSTVRDYLFNIFAVPLHNGGRSSIRNLRTRPAVLTGLTYHEMPLL